MTGKFGREALSIGQTRGINHVKKKEMKRQIPTHYANGEPLPPLKKNDVLRTPEWVWKPLGRFDLDPCAHPESNIAKVNYRLEDGQNGLELPWKGFVWCNPPFSQKELWIEKMVKHGNGILLLPERGSAPWFGPLAMKSDAHFVMGRKINFIGGSSSNNGGSVLFLFGSKALQSLNCTELPGHLNKVEHFTERY